MCLLACAVDHFVLEREIPGDAVSTAFALCVSPSSRVRPARIPDAERCAAGGPNVPDRGGVLEGGACPPLLRSVDMRLLAYAIDQFVDLPRGQVVVVAVPVAHHRRVLARAQALDLLDAEEAVRAHLPEVVDARALLDVVAE